MFACKTAIDELGPGNADRETEIILDLHAAAGLATRPDAVEHDRAQPFRRPVNRRRKPRGTGPDHDEIVNRLV